MKRDRMGNGFTLIELLTVIAIIGVLAAMLFPAIKSSISKAEVASAQNDIQNIKAACKSFYTEYGKWPGGNGIANDYSYGAWGNSPFPYVPVPGHYCENYWLMNTLRAIQDNDTGNPQCGNGSAQQNNLVNTRNIIFINIPGKNLVQRHQNPDYYDYVDPWGNPYQITFDTDFNNSCTNLANTLGGSPGTIGTPVGTYGCVTDTVAVWSFGPLGPYGTHANPKDWITSWQ